MNNPKLKLMPRLIDPEIIKKVKKINNKQKYELSFSFSSIDLFVEKYFYYIIAFVLLSVLIYFRFRRIQKRKQKINDQTIQNETTAQAGILTVNPPKSQVTFSDKMFDETNLYPKAYM